MEEVKQEEKQLKENKQDFLLSSKRLKVENRDLRQELEEMIQYSQGLENRLGDEGNRFDQPNDQQQFII